MRKLFQGFAFSGAQKAIPVGAFRAYEKHDLEPRNNDKQPEKHERRNVVNKPQVGYHQNRANGYEG
jgi:hypothetical protein